MNSLFFARAVTFKDSCGGRDLNSQPYGSECSNFQSEYFMSRDKKSLAGSWKICPSKAQYEPQFVVEDYCNETGKCQISGYIKEDPVYGLTADNYERIPLIGSRGAKVSLCDFDWNVNFTEDSKVNINQFNRDVVLRTGYAAGSYYVTSFIIQRITRLLLITFIYAHSFSVQKGY